MPVLRDRGRLVAGVVSEADLLTTEVETGETEAQARSAATAISQLLRHRKQPHVNLTRGARLVARAQPSPSAPTRPSRPRPG